MPVHEYQKRFQRIYQQSEIFLSVICVTLSPNQDAWQNKTWCHLHSSKLLINWRYDRKYIKDCGPKNDLNVNSTHSGGTNALQITKSKLWCLELFTPNMAIICVFKVQSILIIFHTWRISNRVLTEPGLPKAFFPHVGWEYAPWGHNFNWTVCNTCCIWKHTVAKDEPNTVSVIIYLKCKRFEGIKLFRAEYHKTSSKNY